MRSTGPKDLKLIASVSSPITDQAKKAVLSAQTPMAVAIAKLEDELTALEAIEKLRANEPKRWQANYDYTVGQMRLRLAILNEYNLALGHVRTESLPELPTGSTGWRLMHTDKMLSKKNVQEMADAANSVRSDYRRSQGNPVGSVGKTGHAYPTRPPLGTGCEMTSCHSPIM